MQLFGSSSRVPKRYLAGTHRARSPAETLALYGSLMERCGISRLANITGLDFIGIPVYAAIRPLSRSLSISQGKGADREAAKASALMEALECWHAENIEHPLRYETFRALRRTDDVLAIDADAASEIPLDPDRPTLWIKGWEFFQEAPVWVPFEHVHLNFVKPSAGPQRCRQNSNGLASGNCVEEACVHALCELIERDATSLWFLDPREGSDKRTQLDLKTVDAGSAPLIAKIEAAGLHVGAYDATSDIGIPCYHAIVFDRPKSVRAMGYFWGFGCHLMPQIALSRAITEAVQCRLTEITGAREDILPSAYQLNRDDAELAEMEQMLLSPPPMLNFAERQSLATDSFDGDLEILRGALRRAGFNTGAVVDLSRTDIGLPVVKAVVPGLEGTFRGPEHQPGPRARRMIELRNMDQQP